ncbi:MAG: iron transporter [Thiotrichales bacterium]|nr:iron transporter [Thiotrichales bacterium]MBT3613623.1 iron transporter [Thiotrichales bacterium]MBT3752619.1 iron transporter [Thiotrichales bacterium]MBT3837906.1 iron transporter [Thiotrichales bacterium]MBT4261607.1 iron transporter [Thiotrichales bacterium]
MKFKKNALLASMFSVAVASSAMAGEFPIGDPVEKNGMEIVAVYLQPVTMYPMLPGMEDQTDIHLEADIHALKGNKNGFGAGEWMPYLDITWLITKKGSDWVKIGNFDPMVASDGPHYASNIKLKGAGKYTLRYTIRPPAYNGYMRHTDKETGVGKWWKPFDLDYDFTYTGSGKKGGY